MKKRIIIAIIGLVILIAVLAGIKALQIYTMIQAGKKQVPPPQIVTTATARTESWETALTAVGSLTAFQGVNMTAELAGKVVQITFTPGSSARRGDLLVRQDTSSEEAQLPGAVAQATLTKSILDRDAMMLEKKIISQAEFDTAIANFQQAVAQVGNIRATIAKKTIRAPFSGRLGIRQVNLGQTLREGDPIVTLQTLDPIYVNFSLPQQELSRLHKGLPVRVTCDALPDVAVNGRITAMNPLVDADTRNIQVQATVANKDEQLRPGMFVNTAVGLPVVKSVLTIPTTAVLYAPYGDSVFIVADDTEHKGEKVLRQQFVRLGEKRGDFVAVISGLKGGEAIVSTGVFKLRNGQAVKIDNKLAPPFSLTPKPENN